jgi:hypothetical protein
MKNFEKEITYFHEKYRSLTDPHIATTTTNNKRALYDSIPTHPHSISVTADTSIFTTSDSSYVENQ